ncbi:Uncharacterised protein [uncultured archaeon]|nr:Uncharacterised protein [uncultured archaeon]
MSGTALANASIKTFRIKAPEDNVSTSENPVLEIPLDEFKAILADLTTTYNLVAELVRDSVILRGRELARMTTEASNSIKAGSPIEKVLLLNAHTRRLLAKVRDALKRGPSPESEKIIHVCSKIQARALQIIDYVKTYGEGEPTGKRDVGLDSQQARLIFKGADKEKVSRRDTIRAMKRAETLWPAMTLAHRPNDGRQTMRLTIPREDLRDSPETNYRTTWQRSRGSTGLAL